MKTLLTIVQDICDAWRQLREAPGFAVVAVLRLALGIGANIGFCGIAGCLFTGAARGYHRSHAST